MFNTSNPAKYKPPKNAVYSNTPSSKKPKQISYGVMQNQPEKIRESSPSTTTNLQRNVYNYQNILQKVVSNSKKFQQTPDGKQLVSNQNNKIVTNPKIAPTIAQKSLKQGERVNLDLNFKCNGSDRTNNKDSKSNNISQEKRKNEQPNLSAKPSRPSSANHPLNKGFQAGMNSFDISPIDSYIQKPLIYNREMEKAINLIGKEKRSQDSSPTSILRKNSKGLVIDSRPKGIFENRKNVNKRVTLDLEEDLNSRTIENILMPMTATCSFSLNRLNSSFKGTKTGRHAPVEKGRQNTSLPRKPYCKETFDIEYGNFVKLWKEDTNNASTTTTKESPIQTQLKIGLIANSKTLQSEMTTQRLHLLENSNLQGQTLHLNEWPPSSQEYQQNNSKAPNEQLNSRNLNVLTGKESKGIDITSFLKNFVGRKPEERKDLSFDSYASQIPNENVQIPDLPVTAILDKSLQTKKASEVVQNLISSRRDISAANLGASFASSMKNYLKGIRPRSENPPKATDNSKNMKIQTSNDNLELENTIKRLMNTSDTISREAYKRIVGIKPDNKDDRVEVTKGYNFNKDEKANTSRDNQIDQNKTTLHSPTPKNIKRAPQNDVKHELSQKQSLKDISILSNSAEERETKKAIFKQDYIIGKEIGRGAYAVVRCGTHKPSEMKVAIKIYHKEKISDPMRRKSVRREIKVMQRMNHPNIIKIYDTFETRNYVNIIMEYVDGPSLYTFLKSQTNRRLKEKNAFKIFKQLVSGLDYCHSRCIAHRDIKLENILLDRSGNLKIIDFGFTTCIPNDKKVKLFCGTPSYMAPEIVQKKEYCGPPVDIWALGILLYVLLCGNFPFKGDNDKELYKAISKGEYTVPEFLSDEAESLLRKILNIDPDKRPTAKEIISEPWYMIHSFLEKKKSNKHRRCVSAEKTKGGLTHINTNMIPELLEIKNNNEGFINLNQFTTNARMPFCFPKDKDEAMKEKCDDIFGIKTGNVNANESRKKRCQTPTYYQNKTKHFTFNETNGNFKLNLKKYNDRSGCRETDNILFGLEDTYDENKILKKTLNEIEIWNNNTNLSDKSGKKENGKNSLLNKTIAILNKSERRDDTIYRYDPEAIKNIIKMGYTEEEIIRRLKDKCGIIFAIYTWMTKDKKLSQNSNLTDSISSESSGLHKTCYNIMPISAGLKKNLFNQKIPESPSNTTSTDQKNFSD